jgi:hypothetical protein
MPVRTDPEFRSSATDTAADGLGSGRPSTPEISKVVGANVCDGLQ